MMTRDWETVARLENWKRVFGPRRRHPWGKPPFQTLEEKLVLLFGRASTDGRKELPAPKAYANSRDAEKVSAALCSPFLPEHHKRVLLAFYLASPREWSQYSRLCRKAGTTRRNGEKALHEAERFLGVVLYRFFDKKSSKTPKSQRIVDFSHGE